MYFECNDWLYGTYLTKVSILKGILILLSRDSQVKFIPWWQIKKDK